MRVCGDIGGLGRLVGRDRATPAACGTDFPSCERCDDAFSGSLSVSIGLELCSVYCYVYCIGLRHSLNSYSIMSLSMSKSKVILVANI